jgi:hypothetical protein
LQLQGFEQSAEQRSRRFIMNTFKRRYDVGLVIIWPALNVALAAAAKSRFLGTSVFKVNTLRKANFADASSTKQSTKKPTEPMSGMKPMSR